MWIRRKHRLALIDRVEHVHEVLLDVVVFEEVAFANDGQDGVVRARG